MEEESREVQREGRWPREHNVPGGADSARQSEVRDDAEERSVCVSRFAVCNQFDAHRPSASEQLVERQA